MVQPADINNYLLPSSQRTTGGQGPQPPSTSGPAQPAPTTQNAGYTTSTPGFGAGGVSPQYGTQSPTFLGTGTYTAPLFPINDTAITGAPTQGAAQNYGLNNVWSNLSNELAAAPKQGAGMATATVGGPASYQAATGNAAQVNAAQTGYATSDAAQAQAAAMQAAQGGYAQADNTALGIGGNSLAEQQALARTLNTQATGGGVSAADLQLKAGTDAGIAQQLAILGSQRGQTNAALAQRNAADQGAAAHAVLNQQMGIQRAQETQAAQQAEGSVLAAQGSQAAGINATQAGLTQQTSLANAANAQQSTLANTQNIQAANAANAQLSQQAALQNAGFTQQTSLANAENAQQAGLTNAQLAQQAGLANQGATNAMTSGNLAAVNAASLGNAQLSQQQNLANLGATNAATLANQQTQLANSTLYDNEINAVLGAQAGIGQANKAASLADQQLQLQQLIAANQVNEQGFASSAQANANLTGAVISGVTGLGAAGVNALANSGGSSGAAGDITTQVPSGDIYATGGTLPANRIPTNLSVTSDENLKTGIEGGNPMMQSFLRNYRSATAGDDAGTKIDVNEGSRFRNPSFGQTAGTPGSPSVGGQIGATGGSIAGGVGGAAAGAAAGSVVPGVGTAIGGLIGGILGSQAGGAAGNAIGSAIAPGTTRGPGGTVMTNPGSGVTVDESGWGEMPTGALSDENEKAAVTSGNRGMQAFLQQANAQTGAQNNSGSQSNAFMQTGGPPTAQVDTQLPSGSPFDGFAPQGSVPTISANPLGVGYSNATAGSGGFSDAGPPTGGTSSGGGFNTYGGYQGATMGHQLMPGQANVASPFAPGQTPPMLAAATSGTVKNTGDIFTQPGTQAVANPLTAGSANLGFAQALSDEDEKEKSTEPHDVQKMLDQLSAFSYRYKNPNAPGAAPGQRLGVMAQDLERSPLGRTFVRETPNGKMVDYGQMAGTQLAATAFLNERLDHHEAMLNYLSKDRR